ncbi:MAG TPA: hemerythrin family protein [Rhizomicrobium sp.]|nr:hemerythrin family protein [Rhizomicrobium sp.]
MGDAFLSWQETYAVGHLGLDLEHKRLVEIINEISGVRAGVNAFQQLLSLSNAFYFASVEHFRHENSVMRELIEGAYLLEGDSTQHIATSEAAINDHCAEHARALIQLEHMLQAYSVAQDRSGPLLASELRIWFLDHAINHDAHLKEVFRRRNTG